MLIFPATSFLLLLPAIVSAAIFPPNTKVKMLDPKGFQRTMRSNVGELEYLFTVELIAFIQPENQRCCICRTLVWGKLPSELSFCLH